MVAQAQTPAASQKSITVPVPDHRELRTGTLMGIIEQSGLPRTMFEDPE